jgi:cytochrome c oxidase assembly protein subunit 15
VDACTDAMSGDGRSEKSGLVPPVPGADGYSLPAGLEGVSSVGARSQSNGRSRQDAAPEVSKWPHRVAWILVLTTAVLLCFGALVTSYEAAMAVPDWPATYGHNMLLFPWSEWLWGPWDLFLEHGHRLLGAAVGCITLTLCFLILPARQPSAIKALVVAALLLVITQGILGGARVLLDDKTVAKVHACTGPLFFAVTVALAVLTNPRRGDRMQGGWLASADTDGIGAQLRTFPLASPTLYGGNRHGRLLADSDLFSGWSPISCLLLVAAYGQLVAGAQLRHFDVTADPGSFRWLVLIHIIGACLVTLLAIASARGSRGGFWNAGPPSHAGWLAWAVLGMVLLQIGLGCGTWVVQWGLPAVLVSSVGGPTTIAARSLPATALVTCHVVLGMLVLGASVALCLAGGRLSLGDFALGPGRRAVA